MFAQQANHENENTSFRPDPIAAKKKILVVDDDLLLLEIFAEYLTSQGHVVKPIHESRLIAEAIEHEHFDYIISDYNMPGFNFEEDLLSLAASEFFPQVIMVTGDPRLAEDEQFPFPVLIKPFDFKQLKQALAFPISKTRRTNYRHRMYQ